MRETCYTWWGGTSMGISRCLKCSFAYHLFSLKYTNYDMIWSCLFTISLYIAPTIVQVIYIYIREDYGSIFHSHRFHKKCNISTTSKMHKLYNKYSGYSTEVVWGAIFDLIIYYICDKNEWSHVHQMTNK